MAAEVDIMVLAAVVNTVVLVVVNKAALEAVILE